jgi:hypothetical protein
MKTFFSTTLIVLLLLFTNLAQAQTTQTKLNQVELMKQLFGSWKCETAKDTTFFYNGNHYGTGMECEYRIVTKGKILMEGKALLGYDKRIDKFIAAELNKGADMILLAYWFTSTKKYVCMNYSDISTPETTSWKIEGEIKSPDMYVETILINNKPVNIGTWTRVK